MKSIIKDINLSDSGRQKIEWVRKNMPLCRSLEEEFARDKPFAGLKFTVSVHLEAKTAYLAKVLAKGGASVSVTGSNPLSTQDDVAAAVAEEGINVFAWYNENPDEYKHHLIEALSYKPNIVIDDGGDLASLLHTEKIDLLPHVLGGCEETTTCPDSRRRCLTACPKRRRTRPFRLQ